MRNHVTSAPSSVFRSPAVYTPDHGREAMVFTLSAMIAIFEGFR